MFARLISCSLLSFSVYMYLLIYAFKLDEHTKSTLLLVETHLFAILRSSFRSCSSSSLFTTTLPFLHDSPIYSRAREKSLNMYKKLLSLSYHTQIFLVRRFLTRNLVLLTFFGMLFFFAPTPIPPPDTIDSSLAHVKCHDQIHGWKL